LPNRQNVVLTRGAAIPGVTTIHDLTTLDSVACESEVFVIGGAEIYQQTLDRWSDLYLSVVQREVEGDTFFPVFEDRFTLAAVVLERAEFSVHHYRRDSTPAPLPHL
jgi:dihydrofolate reductase